MEKHENVMVDLETLGRRAGCVVLSIGAVAFGPQGLGKEMYCVVSTDSCTAAGLHIDPDTLKWWEGKEEAARAVLTLAKEKPEGVLDLAPAMQQLTEFLCSFGIKRVKVWGNGSDFDNAILANCYAAAGQDMPWEFWNNRCYRTLKSLKPQIKMARQGTYHNALDDAKSQALHAIELLRG